MRAINLNNIENLRTEFEGNISVMYGAGGNGERILNIFREHSIKIDFFVDDDHNKWGGPFVIRQLFHLNN